MPDYARLNGSEDMDIADKIEVGRILYRLGWQKVRFNMFAVEKRSGLLKLAPEILVSEKDDIAEFHRPDVTAFSGTRRLVVEIDGAVHRGGKKDQRRDEFYRRHGIPAIVLNKADVSEAGISWDEFLGEAVGRVR